MYLYSRLESEVVRGQGAGGPPLHGVDPGVAEAAPQTHHEHHLVVIIISVNNATGRPKNLSPVSFMLFCWLLCITRILKIYSEIAELYHI